MKTITLALCTAALLTACGGKVLLVHDTLPGSELENAKWACDGELGMRGAGSGASSDQRLAYVLMSYRGDLEKCLSLKGWRRAAVTP